MGFKAIGKPKIRGLSLRRKSKSGSQEEKEPVRQKYEFRVTSNPKELSPGGDGQRVRDDGRPPAATIVTKSGSTESTAATDDTGAVDQAGAVAWGWIVNACWGSRYCNVGGDKNKDDEPSYRSSVDEEDDDDDDDGSDDSSRPSASMVDRVLDVSAAANDDVSDVTSAPSIDDDGSDSQESMGT